MNIVETSYLMLRAALLITLSACSQSMGRHNGDADDSDVNVVECTPIEDGTAEGLACPPGCSPILGLAIAQGTECIPSDWADGTSAEAPPIGCLSRMDSGVELPAHTCLMNTSNGVRSLFVSYPADIQLGTSVRPCTPAEFTICE